MLRHDPLPKLLPMSELGNAMPRLTDTRVASLKPPGSGQAEHSDDLVVGLRLRIGAGGRKAWIVRTRAGGKSINKTLGSYPVLSLAEARHSEARNAMVRSVAKIDQIVERGRAAREQRANLIYAAIGGVLFVVVLLMALVGVKSGFSPEADAARGLFQQNRFRKPSLCSVKLNGGSDLVVRAFGGPIESIANLRCRSPFE